MTAKDFRLGLLLLAIVAAAETSTHAELPSRVDQIKQRYQRDRARGLKTLTERYLDQFEVELKRVLAAQDLEEANRIKAKMDLLRKESEEMSAVLKDDTPADVSINDSFLAGKTIFFKHDRHPDEVSFVFEENGEATWAYTGNESVPRQYKATGEPRQFLLWWPGQERQPSWEITVAEDGKTATMRNTFNDYTSEGRIEKTK